MAAQDIRLRRIYCDTSFLVSHLIDDEHTDDARSIVARLSGRAQVSELTCLEYSTAIYQKVGRGEFSNADADKAIAELNHQLARKWFVLRSDVELNEVWKRALHLSESYTALLKLRSLDIWHVAFAEACSAEGFLTFDKRQSDLALAVGMDVNP